MQKNIYSREWLDKLIYNNNIVSVISKYLPLQKKNNKFWACCPFHHEKTPSFVVNELEGYYHCFGCGESGNVITFIEKIEGLDFVESVKLLAENANMEIPTVLADENLIQRKKQRDLLVQICTDTAKFYHNQLISENGKSALNYLIKRGVTKQTMVKMGLGYSPNWTSLVSHLKSKNYSYEAMKEAGVVGEKDGRYYDLMAERVMFPVIDHSNRVVGFSGRSLDPNAQAKYKNTPQTSLFKKSEIIYGLNTLRKARLEKDKNFESIDEICDPFSLIVANILKLYPEEIDNDSEELRENLYVLGYALGKWIYVIDALDDLEEDIKNNKFNPINYLYNIDNKDYKEFIEEIKPRIEFTILNCGYNCKEALEKLPIKRNKEILENIISLGMMDKYTKIVENCNCKSSKKRGI